jgi:nitrogen fixation-related uncharacterized protein
MMQAIDQSVLIGVWIGFTVLALVGIAAVLVWAVRSHQFRDQDRARYLALRSGIPNGKNAELGTRNSE